MLDAGDVPPSSAKLVRPPPRDPASRNPGSWPAMNCLRGLVESGSDKGVLLAKQTQQLLELLQNGTENGRPVAVSGGRLTIDAPELKAPPRKLDVSSELSDARVWWEAESSVEISAVCLERESRQGLCQGLRASDLTGACV
eukprot:629639-Rhodomonas_salina.1